MGEVRARLGCAALTLTLLLNLFPATAQAINSEYCPDGEPCTHEAAIGTTHYDTLEEAVSAAKAYQTITMRNHVELSAQVTIPDHVTLNGRGRTISVESEHWSSADPGKYLLVCGDGVTIHDVTLDGEGVASGLQFFQASKGKLEGFVTLKNAKELGLNINASQVTMDGVLTMKGNGWGNVINVGWGSIVSGMDRSSFDGSDAALEGVTAIYTDHSDVRNAGGDESKFSIRVPDSFAAATKEELSALGKAILYAPAVAQTQGTGYLSLAGAFHAAQDDGTITLLASSAGNRTIDLADGRRLTLDLNEFQVGFAQGQTLRISHGDLTLTGQGKLYEQQSQGAPVTLWGSDDPEADPNTTLSRGMIAQMLYALEGKPSVSAPNRFPDVSDQDWYAKAAIWAQSKGIMTGYSDGRFGPNDSLTREQLALILYHYAKSKSYDTSAKADLSQYMDGSSTSVWAQTAMAWAVGEGLLSGRGTNMLAPTGTATRAEVAQIMMNFCENTWK